MNISNRFDNTILREIEKPCADIHGNGCLYEILVPDSIPEKWVPVPTVLAKTYLKRGATLKEENRVHV